MANTILTISPFRFDKESHRWRGIESQADVTGIAGTVVIVVKPQGRIGRKSMGDGMINIVDAKLFIPQFVADGISRQEAIFLRCVRVVDGRMYFQCVVGIQLIVKRTGPMQSSCSLLSVVKRPISSTGSSAFPSISAPVMKNVIFPGAVASPVMAVKMVSGISTIAVSDNLDDTLSAYNPCT